MANAAFMPAFTAVLALAHAAGCSPAPVIDETGASAAAQNSAVEPAPPAALPQEQTVMPAADPATPPVSDATALAVSSDGSKMSFSDQSLKFTVNLPPGGATDPVLATVRKNAEAYFADMKPNSRKQYDEITKSGHKAPTHDVTITWRYTAKAGDIVSLHGIESEWIGQPHPNWQIDTIIARKSGEHLKFDDMLILQRSPSPAVIVALCEALKAEKIRKTGRPEIFDEPIVCVGPDANVRIERFKIALAPSNRSDRFGGIYVYVDPYDIGSYSEGSYELTIQQEIFAEDLKPEFKSLFGGEAPVLKTPF